MDRVKRNRAMLDTLMPEVRPLAERHISACLDDGIELLVVQALRTPDDQAALYAQGRTAPGKKVTNARPGYSWHNFGRAYDIVIVKDGRPDWASPHYKRVGAMGKSLGLIWGGDFKAVRGDLGHFEYHPGLTLAQARSDARI